jgi:RNase P subunit RPR2
MAKKPVCERCQKPLTMEDPDAFKIQHRMPSAYLGTVCMNCGKVECYRCRGGVGLPCSWCSGEVDGAFVHHFR